MTAPLQLNAMGGAHRKADARASSHYGAARIDRALAAD
jgi:hypothetical protein